MSTQTYNTRIKQKRDTSANWTANNPVLLDGEIILVDTADGELRAKVGDGTKTYTQLPFTDEALRSLIPTKTSDLENDSGFKTTDTTYSAGTGISLSGTTFSNSGVRSVGTGSTNGTISVNTNGTSANVAVKGLGSAAYTASTAYDASGSADAVQDNLDDHTSNTSNPHGVTKSQVGLGSVVNTGDSATPVSGGTTKFTTGGAYTELNKKVDKVDGKGLSTNDYTTTEKNKLAGIAEGANAYTHPSYTTKSSGLYKVTVDATGHVSEATAVAKSDITALGIPAQDTTYAEATQSAAGLMSPSDKIKLDDLENNLLVVTVTKNDDDTYTSSHTHSEIYNWYTNGGAVILYYGSSVYTPYNITASVVFFALWSANSTNITVKRIRITSAGAIGVLTDTTIDSLKNPQSLTFVEEVGRDPLIYDGSEAQTVPIRKVITVDITTNGDGTFSASETFRNIADYIAMGWTVCCNFDGTILPLVSQYEGELGFGVTVAAGDAFLTFTAMINSDDLVIAYQIETSSLKNPNALTINGTSYDGSEAVSINTTYLATASSSDGITYTATVDGITELYAGLTVAVVMGRVSASTSPTLNINSLGAKGIRRRLSNIATSVQTGYANSWLAANKAFLLVYDGSYWIVDGLTKPAAADLYGTLTVAKGGTGATTAAAALANLGGVGVDDLPTVLPNPNALTINGKTYDGSEAVDITIAGGVASENILLGQTPFTLDEDATIKLIGSGEHSYTVQGKTIADFSTMESSAVGVQLNVTEEYIEIAATQTSAWHSSHLDITVKGLTVGETYNVAIKGLGIIQSGTTPVSNNGHYIVKNSNGTTLGTFPDIATQTAVQSLSFTADTTNIVIAWYPAGNYWWSTEGYRAARIADIYINKAADGTTRTSIINKSGGFTNTCALGSLSKGVTITSAPSCEVYSVAGGGNSDTALLPLSGKTVVCFGDSLFGMYTGDTSAPAYVAARTGATVHNVGFGGCRMSVHPTSGYAEFCMWALAKAIAEGDWTAQDAAVSNGSSNFPDQLAILKAIDFNEVDCIVIHYGTNDFNGAVIDNTSNKTDYNTLCGALRYSVETLLTAYPQLRIFVSVPAFRFWTDNGTVTYSDTKTNTNGNKLTEFVDALAATAKEYNLPIIDSYYGLGINKINASTFLADGVHHNVDGRKRFGGYIGARLIAEY